MGTTTSTQTAIDRMLAAIISTKIDACDAWTDDAILDATVPNWRFHARGVSHVKRVYRRWFADPAQMRYLRRWRVPHGEIVEYLLTWTEDGVPHAGHHLHVIDLRDGLIERDTFFCGGRWPAGLIAEMEAADG